jgi:four helix bundle protein
MFSNMSNALAALDHERLDVYRLATELHVIATSLLPERGFRVLRDQLERASLGVVLNIAEGVGRFSAGDKHRFFEIARGSAAETAAALEIARLRGIADSDDIRAARLLAVRIVQMLTCLCRATR